MRITAPVDFTADGRGNVRTLLAVFSIAAGVIHAGVVPEHLDEGWIFGVFFSLMAAFQLSWAMAVICWPSARVYATGALVNGTLIGIWAISWAIGLPIGPHPWMPETVPATLLAMLLVVGSLLLFRLREHVDEEEAGRGSEERNRTRAPLRSVHGMSRAASGSRLPWPCASRAENGKRP